MTDRRKGLIIGILLSCLLLTGIFLFKWTKLNVRNVPTTVTVCGAEYELSVSEIDLSGRELSGDVEELLKLTRLKYADLTDTRITPEQYDTIHSALPDCSIVWSVPVGGEYYPSTVENLTLSPHISLSELKNIRYFTRLKRLDASGYPLCDGLFEATEPFRQPDSGCLCVFSGKLYGCPISEATDRFDFSSQKITDVSEFYNVLRFFPNVREIYLGDISVPDEDVDRLNKAFPDISIVWLVEFAKWQVRTDIRVFSTLVGKIQLMTYDEKELFPLLAYCTELRALDLGHNHMSDISLIGNLTKLEVLILAENKMNTIEPLGNLTKLHFLEIYNCQNVDDLSPLSNCTELENLMIYNDGDLRNVRALASCRKLKLLYAGFVNPVDYSWDLLKKELPDCVIDKHTYVTEGVWRNSRKGKAVRYAFSNWKKIQRYNHWDDFTVGKTEVVGRKIK